MDIKKLDPTKGEIFVDYFGKLDFGHQPHWASCYCQYYQTSCSEEDWSQRSGEINREQALRSIAEGKMNGYLAFEDDVCIGWLNADDAGNYIRLEKDLQPYIQNKKVGLTICYVVHPKYRRQGVASALLDYAIDDFRKKDYDSVIALPRKSEGNPINLYRGTLSMYEKRGYKSIEMFNDTMLMRLKF